MKQYDWKKTAQKVARSAALIILAGLLATYQNDPKWLALVPIIEGAQNFIKHWN